MQKNEAAKGGLSEHSRSEHLPTVLDRCIKYKRLTVREGRRFTWRHEQPGIITWLKSLPKPAGLMICNDVCGRQILQACGAAGLRVPDGIAVVGVDDDDLICELSDPPLSSVALDLERAGYESARLLDGLMSGRIKNGYVVHVQPTRVVTRRSSDVIAQDDRLIANALRFIRDHFGQGITVSDVAGEVGVSRRTLERHFSGVMERSILSEIARFRIERAKQMLVETDLPCHRIATGVGFSSLKTFNRTFARREAVTPQRFRQREGNTNGVRVNLPGIRALVPARKTAV